MAFLIGVVDDITGIRHGTRYAVGLEVHLIHYVLDTFAELVIITQGIADI